MNFEEFQAVILDMDGVITRTAGVHARAWKTMFDEFLEQREGDSSAPFDIDRDYREFVDGKPRYEGVKSFLKSRNIDLAFGAESDAPHQPTICGLGNRKNEIFHELLERDGVEVYEDALEQIGNWKQAGLKVAVITSSRNAETVLKAANLLDWFDAQVDGNDLSREHLQGKPAPDMFLHAARLLGVEPQQAVVVEDAIAGVEAGRAGHFGLVVGVARNREAETLQKAGADLVVQNLQELPTVGTLPSALEQTDELADRIGGKRLALFLDYDGTLTPIVRRPEDATLSESMRSLVSQLSEHCKVAIVSGRDRRDVEQMVQLENLIYAGSHGFDIHGPGGLDMQQEEAQNALPELDEAEGKLRPAIDPIGGAHVERKRYAIAVHYREVENEEDVQRIEQIVDEIVREHSSLRKRGGKKIFELQPDVEWDKGRAVLWISEALRLDPSEVVVIYLGDDVTDEDAFQVLRSSGRGIGIRVAWPESGSHASYAVRDCDEVRSFLQFLLTLLQQRSTARHE